MEKCILLVDDDHSLRYITSQILKRQGYQVLEASDGMNGLKLFESNQSKISMVISDFEMPILNGAQMITFILTIKPDLPFIIISARNDIDFISYGLKNEEVISIKKPFLMDNLLKSISECLGMNKKINLEQIKIKRMI